MNQYDNLFHKLSRELEGIKKSSRTSFMSQLTNSDKIQNSQINIWVFVICIVILLILLKN